MKIGNDLKDNFSDRTGLVSHDTLLALDPVVRNSVTLVAVSRPSPVNAAPRLLGIRVAQFVGIAPR
jgi:hypothetical protein